MDALGFVSLIRHSPSIKDSLFSAARFGVLDNTYVIVNDLVELTCRGRNGVAWVLAPPFS
jgi:hypothetical protein